MFSTDDRADDERANPLLDLDVRRNNLSAAKSRQLPHSCELLHLSFRRSTFKNRFHHTILLRMRGAGTPDVRLSAIFEVVGCWWHGALTRGM
ncbi:predicted protein [Sclerotinia sclerotiorum 1980 UF-70]|uniref:Uncharacterized protein n=1 Tax=Sclerotinia sclerotiorum (strain ATCC 18683 / 1980 / Ss-1) TaxID=665079 RepID=A7F9H7_SCLS1|nr:predicted protein [Sclerotinia sclerotiorum 1980 UF-70]EDO00388.1 predicted protein [Sclerotinia sclerotiorum 1980 UF-70]